MEKLFQIIQDWFQKLNAEQKRHLALICTAAFALLLTISVLISMFGGREEEIPQGPERVTFNVPIPAEELFLPDEPDYIPGVLVERVQRTSWSEEDAALYWQDPLNYGEEQWREKLEAAIDDMLERVP